VIPHAEGAAMLAVAVGTVSTSVAVAYNFDQVGEAITKATQSGGKVLFKPKT
jgi:hypothetical protein